jgi:LAO/AO transport system kinase
VSSSELALAIRNGDRRALGRAITLAESSRPEDRDAVEQLLALLAPATGAAHRVALTGPPGAGKSTLLDALGAAALARGGNVAVLAIDPASAISGGSLLGDALRMPRLAASERVFLRSSSNAGTLGGTAPGTRESVLLCEAAGFRLVLIETVGVGQAEQAVRDVCDTLVLLALAGAGDEIQGIKRGLLEVADAVIVNKADGAGEAAAHAFAGDMRHALALLRPSSPPHVGVVSARTEQGVAELFEWLSQHAARLADSGELQRQRQRQLSRAFRAALSRALLTQLATDTRASALLARLEAEVAAGQRLPTAAARELTNALFTSWPGRP